jgi:hypothetical protein
MDVAWWLEYSLQWNQTSVFYEDHWKLSTDINLATDASDLGMGGVYKNHWFMEAFSCELSAMSIAWRELFAIVIACTLWGSLLTGQLLYINCDNMSIVYCVNSGTSKCPMIMKLIRELFFVAASFHFDVRLKHIPGVDNVGPDRLSRLDLAAFRQACPRADLVGAAVSDLVDILA